MASGRRTGRRCTPSTRPERPDRDTLELARETCMELIASPGARGPFMAHFHWDPTGMEASFEEPPKDDLRAYLVLLRTLDMPTSDIRMSRLFPILARQPQLQVAPWPAALAGGQQWRAALQVPPKVPQHPDLEAPLVDGKPPVFTPAQAWRLWLDAVVIHHDYAKERRWARLDVLGQWTLRTLAHDYALMLARVALLVDSALEMCGIGPVPDEVPPDAPLVRLIVTSRDGMSRGYHVDVKLAVVTKASLEGDPPDWIERVHIVDIPET